MSAAPDGGCRRASIRSTPSTRSTCRWGRQLYDEFKPGQTSLDGVPLPYAGWVEQMTRLRAVGRPGASALPAVLRRAHGLNENHGTSHYNSLQAKLEKRFSGGIYALVSYTLSKTISSGSDNTQRDAETWSGAAGRHLTVREEPQRGDRLDRHSARPVRRLRLRAPGREG